MGFILILIIVFIGIPFGGIIFAIVQIVELQELHRERRSPSREMALIQKSIAARWILLAGTSVALLLFTLFLYHLANQHFMIGNPGCVPC